MRLVLDTNVVIAWLVFNDPFIEPLRRAIREQAVMVITHAPAIEELQRVLAYRTLKLNEERQTEIFARYQAQTFCAPSAAGQEAPTDSSQLPDGFPRCRDPDDNHFLALTYLQKAHALVSLDRAVLKLKRRARKFGFEIFDVRQIVSAVQTLAS